MTTVDFAEVRKQAKRVAWRMNATGAEVDDLVSDGILALLMGSDPRSVPRRMIDGYRSRTGQLNSRHDLRQPCLRLLSLGGDPGAGNWTGWTGENEPLLLPPARDDTEHEALARAELAEVFAAIARLEPKHQRVLYAAADDAQTALAALDGVTLGAVSHRLVDARRCLRAALAA